MSKPKLARYRTSNWSDVCACGCRLGRDEAAARVLRDHGLAQEAALQDHPAGTVGASRHAA